MGLFDLFKKRGTPPQVPNNSNVIGVTNDLTHLENGDLPWGWLYHNKDFIENINNEYSYFLDNWIASRYEEPKKQYEALKSFVLYLEDVEKLCKAKDECFEFWFSEILTTPTYLRERKKELKEFEENFDKLQTQYEERQAELYNLDEKIIKKLKENQGVLQSEFVKAFNPLIQNEVKDKLYHLDKEGKLQRTKSGRSYILNFRG